MSNICTQVKGIIRENLKDILKLRSTKKLKSDGSYVSEGDLLMESLVKSMIRQNYPDYALVSEESPEENLKAINADKVIVLDPIDGTENFISGLKEWGVAVCVYESGKHVESMLALPELDLYMKNGDTFQKHSSRIVGISSSLTKEELLRLDDGFEYRIIGCCVYNMYNVLTGSFCVFENPKGAKVWDILPGLNLALEHKLKVTVNNKKYDGELLRPDQTYIFRIEQK
ncbi:inositol monophosphatase family protein [Sphingobacterium corticibacter]|uniref:Inositol monophosphatase n=1 Tax=Sphingobacterium corticibacter TaxID=2171749 RepID=A0A2T8HJN9_9SPHI|nr:inositol monophosphatase family protein [Sphingobacterium corticibacter]PVH25613.1 inositol monophosphatase [Sphingobacterium corticibacter]